MRAYLLLAALACNPPATVPGDFVATKGLAFKANGVDVPLDVVESVLTGVPDTQKEAAVAAGQAKSLIENVALGDVLYREALARKLHENPEVRVKLALAQREALAEVLLRDVVKAALTDAAVTEAYEKRKVQYARKEAKVRLVPVGTQAEATEIVGLLRAGADFAAVAAERSLDKRLGAQGGDLGWVTAGQLMPAVDGAIFAGTSTGVLDPVEAGGAWVVLSIDERREATPLEEVRAELEQQLEREAAEAFIEEKRKALTIDWVKSAEELLGGAAPAPALEVAPAPVEAAAAEAAPAVPEAAAPAAE